MGEKNISEAQIIPIIIPARTDEITNPNDRSRGIFINSAIKPIISGLNFFTRKEIMANARITINQLSPKNFKRLTNILVVNSTQAFNTIFYPNISSLIFIS